MEVWLGGEAASGPMCGVIMPVYYAMDRMSTEVPEGCNASSVTYLDLALGHVLGLRIGH